MINHYKVFGTYIAVWNDEFIMSNDGYIKHYQIKDKLDLFAVFEKYKEIIPRTEFINSMPSMRDLNSSSIHAYLIYQMNWEARK